MCAVVVNAINVIPTKDGQIGLFISGEAKEQSWFNEAKRAVFVNGMANTGKNHLESAQGLSLLLGCPVIGIYNRAAGLLGDIWQCLKDKNILTNPAAGFDAMKRAVDKAYDAARARNGTLTRTAFVGNIIKGNAATLSLYNFLAGQDVSMRRAQPIYCHSQGNLITSNALTAIALAGGLAAIKGMRVHSFGSPCRWWPAGLIQEQRAFTFDPVTWLDLNMGFQFDKVGFVAAHGFDIYRSHDAEFSVNRFRWGGWGMTANMDEEGLARYCVKIGVNPLRLKGIFQRLDTAHNSDADDVAVLYVAKMRRGHDITMRTIAKADPSLIRLLIKVMDEGPTFADEDREIAYLKTLL